MDRLDHGADRRLQQRPGVFWVEVLDQRGGAGDVCEQDRDLLALALQGVAAGQDLLGQMTRSVALWWSRRSLLNLLTRSSHGRQSLPTLIAEAAAGCVAVTTTGASGAEGRPAAIAELGPWR